MERARQSFKEGVVEIWLTSEDTGKSVVGASFQIRCLENTHVLLNKSVSFVA